MKTTTDKMTISKIASIVTVVAILFGALTIIGSTVFAKVDDVKKLENRIVSIEKVQIRITTQLEGINEGIKDIKKMIKR